MKTRITIISLLISALTPVFSQSWVSLNSGTNNDLWGVSFADAVNGWSCGANGTMIHTTDGGTTWAPQTSGVSTGIIRNITMLDVNNGWAVGDNGVIIQTSNGGTTWNSQTSGVSVTLRQPTFVSSTHGWVCGSSGTILSTTDGGATWNPQSSGTSIGLMSIHFTDVNNGWAVGSSGGVTQGIILHTTDGGANWNPQTAPNNSNLNAVYFSDALNGWAGGNGGTVFSTTDGGSTWTAQTNASTQNIRGAFFSGTADGWMVGDNGSIINTTDGGINWGSQTSGSSQILRSVNFVNSTRGYAVGVAGTILFYNLPSVSANASFSSFSTTVGTPSAAQSFTVTGLNLTGNIVITAPTDFEVSLTAGSGFGSSVSIPPVNTIVPSTTVYVQYNPASAGTHTGNIDVSSSGATSVLIPVDGTSGYLGLTNQSLTLFELYPNPSNGNFIIKSNDADGIYEILDHSGRILLQGSTHSTLTSLQLDLAKGNYFLRLSSNNQTEIQNFIIE